MSLKKQADQCAICGFCQKQVLKRYIYCSTGCRQAYRFVSMQGPPWAQHWSAISLAGHVQVCSKSVLWKSTGTTPMTG